MKNKVKVLKKGTAEYAEILDLANAVHALEKSQRYIDLWRQSIVDSLNGAENMKAIDSNAKSVILSLLANEMNQINTKIENEFTKHKSNA
ncbi:hypothetical protein [Emticicia sp. 17c]|uniref:hypothetical protein n=1 Tax=Emticicia sp. 17c TaxID=3127704 RepID=UPI00301C93D5